MSTIQVSSRVVAALLGATAMLASPPANAGSSQNAIRSVDSRIVKGATRIVVHGTATPTFTVYKLDRPARVVVDIARSKMSSRLVRSANGKLVRRINSWAVGNLTVHALNGSGSSVTRVVVGLARPSSYRVRAEGNDLVVIVTPRDKAPRLEGAAAATRARAETAVARADARRARQAAAATERRAAAEITAAKERAARAEKQIVAAKAEAKRSRSEMAAARRLADAQIKKARREAAKSVKLANARGAEARKRMATADQQMKQAAARLAEVAATGRRTAAVERRAAAALAQARSARISAAKAEKLANERLASAAKAAREAERARNSARGQVGSSKVAANHRRKVEAKARATEQRLARAEAAVRIAEKRRKAADSSAARAIERRRTAETAALAAGAERSQAEGARRVAEAERRRALAERSAAQESRKLAESAATAALTRARAAKVFREKEEVAYRRTAAAQVAAEKRRVAAERARAKLERSIASVRKANRAASQRRKEAAAARAVADGDSHRKSSRRIRAKAEAEAKRLDKLVAAADAQVAKRRSEVERFRLAVARLGSARDAAANELSTMRSQAGKARAARKAEEAKLAELLRRRTAEERQLAQTRSARLAAEASTAAAERKAAAAEAEIASARARASRAKATADARVAKADAAATALVVRAEARAAAAKARADAAKSRADAAAARADGARARAAKVAARAQAASAAATSRLSKANAVATKAARLKRITRTKTAKARNLVRVRGVSFTDSASAARINIELSAPATPKLLSSRGTRQVLVVTNASIARALERTLDTSRYRGPVRSVSSYADRKDPSKIRVVVELSRPTRSKLVRIGNNYRWEFAKSSKRPRARSSNIPAPIIGGYGASSTPIAKQTVAQVRSRKRKVYRGTKIDLDFKDADIHNLLRLLADVGGVNIVIPDEIKYSVTVRMRRVPWDQALEVILASKGLWYQRNGNLYRIAPRKELDAEAQAEAERRTAQIQQEVPQPEYVTLNYSSAKDLEAQVTKMLSPKGAVQVDDRTNTLVVVDVKANRNNIVSLLTRLDTPTPQIQIEARIVEARSTFVRQFGIQWGGNANASSQGGNATGLIFPNSIGVTGGANDTQTVDTGIASPSDFAVNLPAAVGSGAGGALGFALGSVGGNFNINLRLSALEDQGTVRIVSAPKITVVNNVKAKISQGVSIPISVISANGVQTQFVPADLELEVTPVVSQRDCAITLQVSVKKNEADFVNTGARGDPTILRKEAETTILVADGATTVLGGIYTRNTGLSYSKVPFFGDLPVVGWFFKSRRENDERTEVLIFITPKITNKASLHCE